MEEDGLEYFTSKSTTHNHNFTNVNPITLDEKNKIKKQINKIIKDNENKDVNNTVSNLINLIELKYENGSNINAELLLLQNQIHDDSKKAYLEKLFILSDQKFIGIVNLQNQFEKLMREYLNDYYKKKNNSLFINYLIIQI